MVQHKVEHFSVIALGGLPNERSAKDNTIAHRITTTRARPSAMSVALYSRIPVSLSVASSGKIRVGLHGPVPSHYLELCRQQATLRNTANIYR